MKPAAPILLLLGLLALTGCQWTRTAKCGDARVYRTDYYMQLLAIASPQYRIELPKMNLASNTTSIFEVHGLPPKKFKDRPDEFLHEEVSALTNGLEPATLHMLLPPGDYDAIDRKIKGALPWKNSVLELAALAPDGRVLYQGTFRLGHLDWDYQADCYWGWHARYLIKDLEPALQGLSDYQIKMTVKKTSSRSRDFVQLESQDWVSQFFPFTDGSTNQIPPPVKQP